MDSCVLAMRGKIIDNQRYLGLLGMFFLSMGMILIFLALHHKYRGIPKIGGTTQPLASKENEDEMSSTVAEDFNRMYSEMEKEALLMAVRKRDWDRPELVELRAIVQYKEQACKEQLAEERIGEQVAALQAAIDAFKKSPAEGVELDSLVGQETKPTDDFYTPRTPPAAKSVIQQSQTGPVRSQTPPKSLDRPSRTVPVEDVRAKWSKPA